MCLEDNVSLLCSGLSAAMWVREDLFHPILILNNVKLS